MSTLRLNLSKRKSLGDIARFRDSGGVRHLHYVNGSMVVSDIVCKAVLRYARALARAGETEVVNVPTRDVTGVPEVAYVLLGPTSDLFSTPIVGVEDSPNDTERYAASQMERRMVRIHPTRPEWPGEMHEIPDLDVEY